MAKKNSGVVKFDLDELGRRHNPGSVCERMKALAVGEGIFFGASRGGAYVSVANAFSETMRFCTHGRPDGVYIVRVQ